MDVKTAQQILADVGYYDAICDGEIGPATRYAIYDSEVVAGDREARGWDMPRRLIAAAQRELREMGHYAGRIDGRSNRETDAAALAWREGQEMPE